jgi:predicted MFS family arabinose efflux permease
MMNRSPQRTDETNMTARTSSPRGAEFALAVGGLGIGIGEFVIMGLLPDIAQNFGISIPQTGHAISAYALGVVVGAPLIAVVAAKMTRECSCSRS